MNIISNLLGGGNKPTGAHLVVTVMEGRNLTRKEMISKCDIYAVVSIHHKHNFALFGSEQRTAVINNNQNPVWNHTFYLNIRDPNTDLLRIKCYDSDTASFDELIGTADIPLFNLVQNQAKDEWLQLSPAKGGSLRVILYPQGFGHMPSVQAGYYPPQTIGGFAPPGVGFGAPSYPPPGGYGAPQYGAPLYGAPQYGAQPPPYFGNPPPF